MAAGGLTRDKHLGVTARNVEQPQSGTGWSAPAPLPTGGRYRRDIHHGRKYRLTDVEFFTDRTHLGWANRFDRPRKRQGLRAQRHFSFTGEVAGERLDAANQVLGVEFDGFSFHV